MSYVDGDATIRYFAPEIGELPVAAQENTERSRRCSAAWHVYRKLVEKKGLASYG
jgi:hypothetical protein